MQAQDLAVLMRLRDSGELETAVRLVRYIDFDGPDGCWLWAGGINENGYGIISFEVDGVTVTKRVHRVVYELLVGPIPEELVLDHVRARGCRHRHCCSPAHLEPVTRAENNRRGVGIGWPAAASEKGRQAVLRNHAERTHCRNGHELTPENTYSPPGTQQRQCRTCVRDAQRRYDQRRREKV